MKNMMSVTECAKILKVNNSRISQLIKDGRIKAERFGKSWVILDYSLALDRQTGYPGQNPKGKKKAP